MNQSKAFISGVIAFMVGVVFVYLHVEQERAAIEEEYGDKITVVVAKNDILEMEMIEDSDLSTKTVPRKFKQPGAIVISEGEGGRQKAFYDIARKVALSPFKRGEQILSNKIIEQGPQTGLSSQVALTKRALSIEVNEKTGVTKLIKPGDRVDIVGKVRYKTPNGFEEEVKTMLQNIHVLAVGEQIQNSNPTVFETDPITGEYRAVNLRADRSFATATVEVTPAEAQILIYAMTSSVEIFLTLRNPVDQLPANVSTINVDEVLGENSKKIQRERLERLRNRRVASPTKPPPPPNPWLKSGGGSFAK